MLLIQYTSMLITQSNFNQLSQKNQKGRDKSLYFAPSIDKLQQLPNAQYPSQIDGMPQYYYIKGSIARKFLFWPVGLTIYITRQNLLPQVVKDIKLQFKTLKLNDSIPKSRLQVYIYYTAFIRSSIKKYNFMEEDKHILYPIKYGIEGKEVQQNIDLRSALYLIIITL